MDARIPLFLSALLIASPGMSQAAPPSAPPPCPAPEQRQFDFWLGEWEVFGGPDGATRLGDNRIERDASGCWLVEHWRGASGLHGTSTNAWDAGYGVWRQFWVGADGVVLRLQGGLEDGAMVLRGGGFLLFGAGAIVSAGRSSASGALRAVGSGAGAATRRTL